MTEMKNLKKNTNLIKILITRVLKILYYFNDLIRSTLNCQNYTSAQESKHELKYSKIEGWNVKLDFQTIFRYKI